MDRRSFLQGVTGGVAGLLLCPGPLFATSASARFHGEYAGNLGELLFVYDQCSAPHLLREIVEILRHAPPRVLVHVLVSRAAAAAARERLAEFGLGAAHLVMCDEEGISGDWGRDIFQLSVDRDNRKLLGVPWYKAARSREDLPRGWRKLKALATEDMAVQLVPAAFEGGNLMTDVRNGKKMLFAGSTIAVETRALYRAYYNTDPGDDGVARILTEGFACDEVVWLGPRRSGERQRQAHYGFHIDMGMSLVRAGVAVVARCNPSQLATDDHRDLLKAEAERTLAALQRREAVGLAWPDDLDLPRSESERELFLESALQREQVDLQQTATEWEDMAETLANRGYTVHRLEADPRRVRRFQSHTNAIVSADRLVMPIFPAREHVHGWLLHPADGRDRIDVELGLTDSEFELAGDNLAAFQLYQRLHPGVRAVRDYFYLASGNVHCVIGRMS